MNKTNSILLFSVLISLWGCDFIIFKENNRQHNSEQENTFRPIARVHDQYLYHKDLEGLIPENLSKADSTNLADRYVQSWINKQLVIDEASRQLVLDEAEIERKVLDYRYALMIHEFQELYINEKLDKTVTEEEIKQYYNDNKDNFQLKRNIIKGRYVKLPVDAPNLARLRRLIQSDRDNEINELRDYCYQYATTFHLDTLWVEFDEVIANTPMASITDTLQFLQSTTFYETSDEEYRYFLRILDYQIPDQIKPLEFVREEIINIIINKRKIALANELEEQIYERAERNRDFEIYENN